MSRDLSRPVHVVRRTTSRARSKSALSLSVIVIAVQPRNDNRGSDARGGLPATARVTPTAPAPRLQLGHWVPCARHESSHTDSLRLVALDGGRPCVGLGRRSAGSGRRAESRPQQDPDITSPQNDDQHGDTPAGEHAEPKPTLNLTTPRATMTPFLQAIDDAEHGHVAPGAMLAERPVRRLAVGGP